MKFLTLLLLLVGACSNEPQKFYHEQVCGKPYTRKVQVCDRDAGGAVGGGVLGCLLGGPIGCVAGGIIGHATDGSKCYEKEETQTDCTWVRHETPAHIQWRTQQVQK